MEKQKTPVKSRVVEGLAVDNGHFWIRVDGALTPERKSQLKGGAGKTDTLKVVDGDQLWARIERPHPTRRQRDLLNAGL
jgi:hypothetical protein